jgi:hypothetical protein
MKEKILAFLKTKLTGVPNTLLEGVSNQLATTITEESQIETVINAGLISALQASAQYSQQEGDRRATTATETAIKGYEQKYNLKEGKSISQNEPPKTDLANPDPLKPILDKIAALEAKDALAQKRVANDLLLSEATRVAKGKGAANEKLLAKALKLITVEDGVTADQIADKLLLEYNDFQSAVVGEGAMPSLPSRQLSDAEVKTARAAAVKKSAEAFAKKADNI